MNNTFGFPFSGGIFALAFIASAAVQASENKKPDVINRIMAEPVHNLSLMDADPQGTLRWVVWQEGQADSRASYLALYQQAKGVASPVWSTSWSDAWAPALYSLSEWRWQGNALLAVTLQFGAAAGQVELYGLDAKNQPVQLAEKTAASVGWKINEAGERLLVLYEPKPTTLKASCYGWRENTGKLMPQSCN
ncbi:TPA: hypothetical protein I8271_000938 [Kluyvera intermedia]|uniref:Uncharacterized protein n=2 Tax=Enterobacteriaceae TaxID=543 RepID=A0AAC8QLV3_9ENTR|nr:hypothetical protein [Phytobacter ursingii]HAT2203992.1 hypothetical protein [Kluyvera intermedia]AKL11106.1 hypothetical protein AB182_07190 [Phytobacter ursingii]HAT2514705.1 hypothetical protein [Kluyvera intermedia]HAT2602594.1 hypothetical protein [Kluyvera intermedia]HAT2679452.1 hypothetical protein [Kluyvera intermedia]